MIISDDINYLRDRLKTHEGRRFHMILVCASGYSTLIGLSGTLEPFVTTIILFVLMMITENIYYNDLKHSGFLNQLLIFVNKYNIKAIRFEEIYSDVYCKLNRKDIKLITKSKEISLSSLFRFIYSPFVLLPILFILTSEYLSDFIIFDFCYYSIRYIIQFIITIIYILIMFREFKLQFSEINYSNKLDEFYHKRLTPRSNGRNPTQ